MTSTARPFLVCLGGLEEGRGDEQRPTAEHRSTRRLIEVSRTALQARTRAINNGVRSNRTE